MKVLSLFDGISCGMVALDRLGIPVERYCAYEIEPSAIQISLKNYPTIEQCGDVFQADFSQYKGFDLLIGGSPCTYWSISQHNNRETLPVGMGADLFMQYVRALRESGCKYFLYENNHSIAPAIKDFITEKLGVQPIMINSALVSAQQRKRCYWTNIPNVTQPEDTPIHVEDILQPLWELSESERGAMNVLISDQPSHISQDRNRPIPLGHIGRSSGQANRVYHISGKTVCLQSQAGGGGAKTGLYRIDLPFDNYLVRKLTPLEAERCQTLPDHYTEGVSDTSRYAAIGNGWTVNVISHILKNLKQMP